MKKAYVIMLDNGLSYDDQESKPVAVCLSRESAEGYIKDNTPIKEDLFKKTFYHTYMGSGVMLEILKADLIE